MAETTIGIKLQGVDNASQTIEKVKNQLNGLSRASGSSLSSMTGAFKNLSSAGIKQATSALGPLGGAITKLGPIGVAAGLLLIGVMKRYKYEIEQTKKAFEDHRKAIAEMADIADRQISRLEKQLSVRKQLRQLDDQINGADAVGKAKTNLQNIDDEIATVRKQIEEAEGIRKVNARLAASALEDVETVGAGHAVWWETGTEAANKERYKTIEEAQKRSMEYTRKQVELQDRLKVLEKERVAAEQSITAEQEKQNKEQSEKMMKRLSEFTKALAKGLKESMLSALDAAKSKLAALIDKTHVDFSGLYEAGSHDTTKLLYSLQYAQSGTGDVPQNVASILDEIRQLNSNISQLEAI